VNNNIRATAATTTRIVLKANPKLSIPIQMRVKINPLT